MIYKIYWVPRRRTTRESALINQGLINNPRVELVDDPEESDFIFHFYYTKHKDPEKEKESKEFYSRRYDPHKTVIIDYHDNPNWYFSMQGYFAYFKRSWTQSVREEHYTARKRIAHPANMWPLTMAIMDEFIVNENVERDVVLSCTVREKTNRGHIDRVRVLRLLEQMKIQGNARIGQLNRGNMLRFNDIDMRDYFKLLKRSKIVVTCNPSKWEGDHRTWEAFANRALVFVDRTLTPLYHPLVDRKHCIFYDLSDDGLKALRSTITYFLEEPGHANEIAKAGHEFTMKYHRASNRIDEILDVIT